MNQRATPSKLRLNKLTLRTLDTGDLQRIVGGSGLGCTIRAIRTAVLSIRGKCSPTVPKLPYRVRPNRTRPLSRCIGKCSGEVD